MEVCDAPPENVRAERDEQVLGEKELRVWAERTRRGADVHDAEVCRGGTAIANEAVEVGPFPEKTTAPTRGFVLVNPRTALRYPRADSCKLL